LEVVSFLKKYRCLFFDAYGVLNDASSKYQHALSILDKLQSDPNSLCFLVTNDSATPVAQLAARWEPYFTEETIISSGKTVDSYVSLHTEFASIVIVGASRSIEVFTRRDISVLTTEGWTKAGQPKVDALIMMASVGFDWHSTLNTALNLLRLNPDCKLIAPNPDLIYSVDDQVRGIAAGSLAMLVHHASGRQIKWLGKPYQEIFSQAFNVAASRLPNLEKNEVLMVGDTLGTDILGARQFGIDSLYVRGGVGNISDQDSIVPTATVNRLEMGQLTQIS
jgi:HAD superfamily hydrolase (TIGR01450 family)